MLRKFKYKWWNIEAWFILHRVNKDEKLKEVKAPEDLYRSIMEKTKNFEECNGLY